MNWDIAASIGEMIGAVAVVISLVYLSSQVRGGNALQAAQARYNLRVQRFSAMRESLQPHVLEAIHKYAVGEDVTPAQRSAARLIGLNVLETWEWQFNEYRAGMLDREALPLNAWRLWFRGEAEVPVPVREVWQTRKRVLSSDFVEFVEENVVNDV